MRPPDDLFLALSRSRFRGRFRLSSSERAYLHSAGLEEILRHARRFIDERLAPAQPAHDGRQTPMRGHPVFPAQHATATCCRGCLAKWHRIPAGAELTEAQRRHIVAVIERWLLTQCPAAPREGKQGLLFGG